MLEVYSLKNSLKWDSIVKSFKNHDVYYLSGYVKPFALHGDGTPLLFHYENNDIRGINVVMKRDIADLPQFSGKLSKNTYFDFATPYGYGGWLIEGSGNKKDLFEAYINWCVENNIVSEFMRFHPVLNNAPYHNEFCEVTELGNTITMDISSEETIWTNINSKNRNTIRKAQKFSLTVERGFSKEIFEKFKEIYDATMVKNEAKAYYFFGSDFYESIENNMAEDAQVFYVTNTEGTIIAASIIFATNEKLNYHLSGAIQEYRHMAPTNLLLYEAAVWGSKRGCKTFHLGGGVGSAKDSLFDFKKSFYRGEPTTFQIGKKVFNQKAYDMLLEIREDMPEGNYFPKYRA